MKRIPKSFEIGGQTIKVKWVTPRQMKRVTDSDPEPWGASQPSQGVIYMNTKLRVHHPDVALQTFYHELGHCILWVICQDMWGDEVFVEAMGHALLQVFKSSKY